MAEAAARPPRKEVPKPQEEGLPPWMATFADMMTLLLCFFVLLLSFANQDLANFRTLMGSIKEAFGVQTERQEADYAAFSPTAVERKGLEMSSDQKEMVDLVMNLRAIIDEDSELKRSAGAFAEQEGVVVRVESGYLFESGKAELRPGSEKVLDRVVKTLKDHNFWCVIRGHTDDREQTSSLYPTGWELSAARAAAALRYVVDKGISPLHLKAIGYADTRPLVPNDTPEDRAKNRRVEFFIHHPEKKFW